jgi:hypothetical protein
MNLDRHQLLTVRYALEDVIVRRRLGNKPIPPALTELHRHVNAALSASGHENDTASGELDTDDLINAAEAAEILDCSPRHARRIDADLDGQRCPCGRGRVYRRQTVIDYANAKGNRSEHLRSA